ncbi:MAG TPA: hypothetical protein VL240_01125 [Candidatus Binatia bacterium]|nr:hypothetical protein [Candidatus Binatia bacterium]
MAALAAAIVAAALFASCTKPGQIPAEAASQPHIAPVAVTAVGRSSPPTSSPADGPATGPQTKVLMHNVILNERPGFQLRVRWLRGEMRPTHPGITPSFDEPNSFVLDVEAGVVATNLSEISGILNGGLLKGTPLTNISLRDQGTQLKLNGTLHKGIPLPIEMISDVAAAPDGRIRLHVTKMRVLKLPVKGLLQSFHVKVGDLVGANGAEGVQVTNDDIFINPERILPAPAIHGRLTDAHLGSRTGDLITVFGDARPEANQVKQWRNFIRLYGGRLNLGRLTMGPADLFLIDASGDEWFGFDLTRYQEQLVNGRIQMTPQAGLLIFMPDIDKVPRTAANRRINVEWMKNRNIPPPAGVAE